MAFLLISTTKSNKYLIVSEFYKLGIIALTYISVFLLKSIFLPAYVHILCILR